MVLPEKYSATYHAYGNSYSEIQWYLCTMVHVIPIVLTVKYSDTYSTRFLWNIVALMALPEKYSDTYGTSWEIQCTTYHAYLIPTVKYSDTYGTLWKNSAAYGTSWEKP